MHKAWDISRRMQFWKIGVARRPALALLLWSDLWAPKINRQFFTTSATLSWMTKIQNSLYQTPLLFHLLGAPFNEQSPFWGGMVPWSSPANCRCKPQEMIAIMWRQRTNRTRIPTTATVSDGLREEWRIKPRAIRPRWLIAISCIWSIYFFGGATASRNCWRSTDYLTHPLPQQHSSQGSLRWWRSESN